MGHDNVVFSLKVLYFCLPVTESFFMKPLVTFAAALLILPASLTFSQAGPALGADFIFFRNGTNLSIHSADGDEEADPNDATEISLRYDYGDWYFPHFGWDRSVGVDMTANHNSGDVLHLRLRVDPANAGKADTFIMMEDKSNDQPEDLPMRLVWRIPESMRDGNWHDLDIPLPPMVCQDLADARASLTGLDQHWYYGGSWSNATQRVGGYDDDCAGTSDGAQYWKEFEWTNVWALGAFWDYNTGGGSIWIDDVYIGQTGLDLTVADAIPAAMDNISLDQTKFGNMVTWTTNPDFGGYRVYGSSMPITDLSMDNATTLGTLTSSDSSLMHYHQLLHPDLRPDSSMANMYAPHYAVTSLSQFGVENRDVSNSTLQADNGTVRISPIILELSADGEAMLLNSLSSGEASGMGFDDGWIPFWLGMGNYTLGDAAALPDDDDDLSGKFWLGYSEMNELWIYAEVLDDEVDLPSTGTTNPWEYDVIEMGWANYDLVASGGDPSFGSSHQDFARGMYADYAFRIAGRDGGASAFVEVSTPGVGQVGSAVYNPWMSNGVQIGYKILATIPLDAIQDPAAGDVVLDPPLGTDPWRIHAINIVLNDRDGGGRQSQVQTSLLPYANGQWWNTPAQWAPVAMAPRAGFPVAVDNEVPGEFTLDQNYPNPFNPSTNIRFSLPDAESVTLTVHDLLGRTVSTLLYNQTLNAGSHTVPFNGQGLASGMYIYRIQVGSTFTEARRMVLIK